MEHHFGKSLTDAQLTRYSRLCVLFLGIIAIIISLVSKAIIPMLVFAFTMRSAGPFAAFLLGLTWKNATAGAGIWSIVLGSIAGVYWEFVGNPYGITTKNIQSIFSNKDTCQHHTDDMRNAQSSHDDRRKQYHQQNNKENQCRVGYRGKFR